MQVLTTALASPLLLALQGSHAAGCEGAGCPRVYEQFWHAGLSESEHFASSRAVDDLGAVLAQAQARKDAALVTKPLLTKPLLTKPRRPRDRWHASAHLVLTTALDSPVSPQMASRSGDYAYHVLDPEFVTSYWHRLLSSYASLFDWGTQVMTTGLHLPDCISLIAELVRFSIRLGDAGDDDHLMTT